MKKKHFILFILFLNSLNSFTQNSIELVPCDCSEENGFTMFLLDRAKPKVLTEQKIKQIEKYLEKDKMIIFNNSDFLKIEYTNIFGQIIDTTYMNARSLTDVKLCINKFTDYQKKSLIRESIQKNRKWILETTWGDFTFESDKFILTPKNGFFKYKYYLNGKKIKSGKIEITKLITDKIALFERKLNLMQNASRGCSFGISYRLNNGTEKINFQDNSCSGFTNNQLLTELKILN